MRNEHLMRLFVPLSLQGEGFLHSFSKSALEKTNLEKIIFTTNPTNQYKPIKNKLMDPTYKVTALYENRDCANFTNEGMEGV